MKHPHKLISDICSFKNKMFNKTVNGAANEKIILFLLGPIFCKAVNNKVSPKKMPIIPDIRIIFKYSKLIVCQVFINVVYPISINDTKINLNLLKTSPPTFLVTSAEIKDAIAQQNAADIAKK
tara:strand:- start:1117 stop:1485 length:369 start_codon:yes stop_codon:yes gene_type:complete